VISRVVTVGGPPGSGKSTACRRVAEVLGLTYTSAGQLFRAEARQRGLDLEAFGRYAEAHPEVDRTLDERVQALARPGALIEGRIQGALCRRHATPVHDVLVTATLDVRVQRVAQRDHQSLEDARSAIVQREASERHRYRRFYDLDIDTEPSDLTVDTTDLPPDDVAERIVEFLRGRDAGPSR
jgi:predicted cytidylate kinase